MGPPEEYDSGLVDDSMPGPGLACDVLFVVWLLLKMLMAAAPWIGPGPWAFRIGLAFPLDVITSFPCDERRLLW